MPAIASRLVRMLDWRLAIAGGIALSALSFLALGGVWGMDRLAAALLALNVGLAAIAMAGAGINHVLRDEAARMRTAVNHMSQGLCMYDASERLVFCNTRFLEMYRMSPEVVKPGASLIEVLEHRHATGQFTRDPAEYRRMLLAAMTSGQPLTAEVVSQDGQLVAVRNEPLPSGGWVATYDDITERRRVA